MVDDTNEAENCKQSNEATSGIEYPGKHDVLCGRGGRSNNHIGNVLFRQLVSKHKDRYQQITRRFGKSELSNDLIGMWKSQTPPGRFLTRTDPKKGDASLWHVVDDSIALRKVGQCLRERPQHFGSLEDSNSSFCYNGAATGEEEEGEDVDMDPNSVVFDNCGIPNTTQSLFLQTMQSTNKNSNTTTDATKSISTDFLQQFHTVSEAPTSERGSGSGGSVSEYDSSSEQQQQEKNPLTASNNNLVSSMSQDNEHDILVMNSSSISSSISSNSEVDDNLEHLKRNYLAQSLPSAASLTENVFVDEEEDGAFSCSNTKIAATITTNTTLSNVVRDAMSDSSRRTRMYGRMSLNNMISV